MNSPPKSKSRLLLAIVPLFVAAVIVAIWYFTRPTVEPGLTKEQRHEIYRRIELSIADLEGGDFNSGDEGLGGLADAIENLEKLRDELPQEILPARNLAIARLLLFSAGDLEKQVIRFEPARDAIMALLARGDDDRAAALLWSIFLNDYKTIDPDERAKRTISMLEKVPSLKDDPFALFALYRAADGAIQPEYESVALDSLKRAHAAMPSNLYLLGLLLQKQSFGGAPGLIDTLQSAREVVEPLRRTIEIGSDLDIIQVLDAAIEGAQNGESAQAITNANILANAIRPVEAHRRDANLLDPHPLDFVLFRLSDSFVAANPVMAPVPTPNPMDFRPTELSEVLNSLVGVRDVKRVDFSLDETADWVILHGERVTVLNNVGQETIAACSISAGMDHLLVADLDYDELKSPKAMRSAEYFHADVDLVLFGSDGVDVLENRMDPTDETRTLVSVPQTQGLDKLTDVREATLVDIDHDKDLDLVLVDGTGFRVWLNRGNMDFFEATEWSTFPDVKSGKVDLFPVDWDRDADLDVIVVGAEFGTGILENMRHGQVRWRRFDDPFPQSQTTGVTVLEADGNVSWDLATVGETVDVVLTASPAARDPQAIESTKLGEQKFAAVIAEDINNDTAVDLVFWHAAGIQVAYGSGDGKFQPPVDLGLSLSAVATAKLTDLNDDGWLDVVAVDGGKLKVFSAVPHESGGWLKLNAVGQDDNAGYAGQSGIGSLVEIMSGGRYQARVVQDLTTHFGLGDESHADVVRIVWTNGVPQSVVRPEPNQTLVELMVLKGSCPYIYTWTGDGFEFLTDCLWAAPIGLQMADDVMLPSRSWEYLRIPGERLQVDDGHYRLLLTEELWEAAYFDQVKLIAVDHPADTEVYSNEKVGPPSIAEYQLHSVRQRRLPVSAKDKHGADVSDLVLAEDERYYSGWDQRIRQGLTDEHFLELDLGDLSGAEKITLFLRGWIYPTDTSWNISLSQNPDLDAPKMPSIWVVGDNDEWVEAIPYMGFPGGKTKTIAVDVSNVFRKAKDYRLRVVTSGEISWDNTFFTVDEEAVPIQQNECKLSGASLKRGGFSGRLPSRTGAPEMYDYADRSFAPRWAPMGGHFTRYGDVTKVVADSDDQMAVLGSGDSMELRFDAGLPLLPENWKRDFILHCVGWDKDADLNTVHGQAVEPLPYRQMPAYPYESTGEFPTTPEHKDYLKTYQTREASRMWFWRHLPREFGSPSAH
jgi:tetratricopeptide (TPR) repeat protein